MTDTNELDIKLIVDIPPPDFCRFEEKPTFISYEREQYNYLYVNNHKLYNIKWALIW